MGFEVELKLSIDKVDAKKLHLIPLIVNSSVNKPTKNKIISIYFDTPDLILLDAGITFRIRQKSSKWIQTIKLAGTANSGLHQRNEWEDLVSACHPDFRKIKEPSLIKFFADRKLRASLIPIFRTEIMREEWFLSFDNGDQVELSSDSGLIKSNQFQEPINEIELELKAGNVGRIFEVALALQKTIPLRIENNSKAKRGYEYFRPNSLQTFKAKLPTLDKNIDAQTAFKIIATECINHLESNRDIVLMESDIEGIHQMRVALRRLRAAFSLFKDRINSEESSLILTEVSWLANQLGKVRDLDVLITETLPVISEYSKNNNGLLVLSKHAKQARQLACMDMQEAIMSQRYHRLLLTLSSWLEKERWLKVKNKHDHFKLVNFAKKSLNKSYKRLLQSEMHFIDMQPQDRHKVRIAAKKLRYGMEFFYNLYPTKQIDPFIKKLAKLQDRLGQMNDINVTHGLLRSISKTTPSASLNDAISAYQAWGRGKIKQECSKADSALKKLLKVKLFWIDINKY